jgi:hypothetical protein
MHPGKETLALFVRKKQVIQRRKQVANFKNDDGDEGIEAFVKQGWRRWQDGTPGAQGR